MKTIFTIILLVFMSFSAWSQEDCSPERYRLLMGEVDRAVKNGQYDLAINKLQSAKICQPDKEAVVNMRVLEVFREVNKQRELAIRRAEIAKANELAAKAEKIWSKYNNENELVLFNNPNEIARPEFHGKAIIAILFLYYEAFRMNPSKANREGLINSIAELGVMDTVFKPAGKTNFILAGRNGYPILYSSKITPGTFQISIFGFDKRITQLVIPVDTVLQIIETTPNTYIAFCLKNDGKKYLYSIRERYNGDISGFEWEIAAIKHELTGYLLQVSGTGGDRFLIALDSGYYVSCKLLLANLNSKNELIISDQLVFPLSGFNVNRINYNQNLLVMPVAKDSIAFWSVDSTFHWIASKKYQLNFTCLSLARWFDNYTLSIGEPFGYTAIEWFQIQDLPAIGHQKNEKYFILNPSVSDVKFMNNQLFVTSNLDSDFDLIYIIQDGFLKRNFLFGKNKLISQRLYHPGKVKQILQYFDKILTLNDQGQIFYWDMKGNDRNNVKQLSDQSLLKIAWQRIAFNLTKQEWEVFIGDEPYRKMRPDLK